MQWQQWRRKRSKERKQLRENVEMVNLPSHDTIQGDMWVAVAYEKGWFPGRIQNKEDNIWEINFMETGLKLGICKWSLKPDTCAIDVQYTFHQIQTPPLVPTHSG